MNASHTDDGVEIMDMKIALLHDHFDVDHLESVKNEMKKFGAPTIKVLDLDFDDMYQALEGSHRLRAAEILGVTPIFNLVDANDTMGDLGIDDWDNPADEASEVGDWGNYKITIEDGEIVKNATEYMSRENLINYLRDKNYSENDLVKMKIWNLKQAVNDEMEDED